MKMRSVYNYNIVTIFVLSLTFDYRQERTCNAVLWNVQGKVTDVIRSSGSNKANLHFRYDAMGNRISKTVVPKNPADADTITTFYVRDAKGNVMAIYEKKHYNNNTEQLYLQEQHIYGASRLGMLQSNILLATRSGNVTTPNPDIDLALSSRTLGSKLFELQNHLSNVLAVVSDKRLPNNEPDIKAVYDYYPFGAIMNGRSYSPNDYRYSFNGKERDTEGLGGSGSTYDYGFRIYNPNIARFLSEDPLTKKFPWWTPYQFAGNMPIRYIDLDGLEPENNPDNPANQDKRNPTNTINFLYELSGGDANFDANYYQGTFDANATLTNGVTSTVGQDGRTYVSGNPNAHISNEWVSNKGLFKIADGELDNTKFSNYILGSLINGAGYENIEFPQNGIVSNRLRNSGIVQLALNDWSATNQCRAKRGQPLVGTQFEYTGALVYANNAVEAAKSWTVFNPETLIGSAVVSITPINNKELLVQIFNITSLTSGDFAKHLPWNNYVTSSVRTQEGNTPYGNISQTFSFTMPIKDNIILNNIQK
jgi:RHS repeat-associated protein